MKNRLKKEILLPLILELNKNSGKTLFWGFSLQYIIDMSMIYINNIVIKDFKPALQTGGNIKRLYSFYFMFLQFKCWQYKKKSCGS